MPSLLALHCSDDPAAWAALGLPERIGEVEVRFVAGEGGLVGWTLAGDGPAGIDGIPTAWESGVPVERSAVALDHVVVFTDDVGRTTAALVDAGGDKRRRAAPPDVPVPMAFVKLGDTVVDVAQGGGQPRLWGVTVVVDDLDALDPALVGTPRDAIQPGRRIVTVRPEAGLRTAVAFMTPRVRTR